MKEATKTLKDSKTVQEDEIQELRALLSKTKAVLKEERDKVIELEDYTRHEDLKNFTISQNQKKKVLTTRRNKLFSAFCKRSCKWTLHKFDFTQCIGLASEKKTNID